MEAVRTPALWQEHLRYASQGTAIESPMNTEYCQYWLRLCFDANNGNQFRLPNQSFPLPTMSRMIWAASL